METVCETLPMTLSSLCWWGEHKMIAAKAVVWMSLISPVCLNTRLGSLSYSCIPSTFMLMDNISEKIVLICWAYSFLFSLKSFITFMYPFICWYQTYHFEAFLVFTTCILTQQTTETIDSKSVCFSVVTWNMSTKQTGHKGQQTIAWRTTETGLTAHNCPWGAPGGLKLTTSASPHNNRDEKMIV